MNSPSKRTDPQTDTEWARGIEAAASVLEIAIDKGANIKQLPSIIRRLKSQGPGTQQQEI